MSINLKASELSQFIQDSLDEYEHDLKYRNKREPSWADVEDLYFGNKKKSLVSRANVHIPKVHGTVETFVAKIDAPPFINYEAMEEGDKPKAEKMNALLRRDMNKGDWELKDLLGKKEAALYGRCIYKKYSSTKNNFTDHMENVDVLDFYIDPMAGGAFPMENAKNMGQDNIIKSIYDLQDSDLYDQKAVKRIARKLKSDSDVDNRYRSRTTRQYALGLSDAVLTTADSIRFIEHYRYHKGELYLALIAPEFKEAVRVEKVVDALGFDDFPFISWAVFPRLFEFWTPSVAELVKEANKIQNVIISQILDNTTFRNYGMKAYDMTKIDSVAELTPRPMGTIGVNGNPKDIIQDISFQDITPSLQVYNLMETAFDKETGVTGQSKGMPNSKRMSATEFAGLLDETADRFFTANRTYRHALRRIAKLYQQGVEANMRRDQRVRILGTNGFEWDKVSPKDAEAEFDISISTGATKEQEGIANKQLFREYIVGARKNERLNQAFLDEKEAQNAGLTPEEVQRVVNPEMEGDWVILAEAESENQRLLKSKTVEPNRGATIGHVQKHIDFARKTEGLSPEIRRRILAHANAELPMIEENEDAKVRKMMEKRREKLMNDISTPLAPSPSARSIAPEPPQGGVLPPQPQLGVSDIDPEMVRQAAIQGIQGAPPPQTNF